MSLQKFIVTTSKFSLCEPAHEPPPTRAAAPVMERPPSDFLVRVAPPARAGETAAELPLAN
jgi:hypothetical protein